MKRKAYSRGEREDMILNVFYSMVGDGLDPHMTAYEMARVLGMNSAQHVRNIMEQMVVDKRLSYTEQQHRPGVWKRIYIPFPLIPALDRSIPAVPRFRINGKEVK